MSESIRLNKYIAHGGSYTRREAADLIKKGLVTVNNVLEKNPAYVVQENDVIVCNGKQIKLDPKFTYVLINKPKKVVCSSIDESGRRTVVDIVKKRIPVDVIPIGMLDYSSVGLVVLTDDTELLAKLTNPKTKVRQLYHVIFEEPIHVDYVAKVRSGIPHNNDTLEVKAINILPDKENKEVMIETDRVCNDLIRNLFDSSGYKILRLDRLTYAGLTKKDLPRGFVRHLTDQEVIMLKHFIK